MKYGIKSVSPLRSFARRSAGAVAGVGALLVSAGAARADINTIVAAVVTDVKEAAETNIGLAMGVGAVFLVAIVAWKAIKSFAR